MDRLSPLPKRIDVSGWFSVRPDELVVAAPKDDVWACRAADEFCSFLKEKTGTAPKRFNDRTSEPKAAIHFHSSGTETYAGLFDHPFFGDFNFYPGYQSYRVATLSGQGGLVVQGLDREGVYWGMKTLRQLVEADKAGLRLPRVLIVDGADMEERGIWSFAFGTTCPQVDRDKALAHYKTWLDWMSDHKLNLFEVMVVGESGGVCFRSRKHPEFACPDAEESEFLLRALIPYGKARGIRMVPLFSHGEHYGFIGRKFPELVPADAISHHGNPIRLSVDFFKTQTRQILQDLAEEVVDTFSPRGLCFWFTESRLHSLPPKEQKGRSEFLQEATVYHGIAERLREQVPGLGCKILLTQGSFPENLALMRAFPTEVQWIYYSGERFGTYNIREKNPIHRDIAAAAAEGRWISLCNALHGIPGRPAHLETIYRNIGYALDAGLKGLDGWACRFPGDKLAMTVVSERAWNGRGRSLVEILRAAATEAGAKDAAVQAESYALYDQANFAQAIRNSTGIGQPFGNFSRLGCMLERIRANAPVDELIMIVADAMETDDLPALAKAIEDAEVALAQSDAMADLLFRVRCQYLLRILRISQAIVRAFYVNCREKCWDLHKGPWQDYRAVLRGLFAGIQTENALDASTYAKVVRMEGSACSEVGAGDPLLKIGEWVKTIDLDGVSSSRDVEGERDGGGGGQEGEPCKL